MRLIGELFNLVLTGIGIGLAIASILVGVGYMVYKIIKRRDQ